MDKIRECLILVTYRRPHKSEAVGIPLVGAITLSRHKNGGKPWGGAGSWVWLPGVFLKLFPNRLPHLHPLIPQKGPLLGWPLTAPFYRSQADLSFCSLWSLPLFRPHSICNYCTPYSAGFPATDLLGLPAAQLYPHPPVQIFPQQAQDKGQIPLPDI